MCADGAHTIFLGVAVVAMSAGIITAGLMEEMKELFFCMLKNYRKKLNKFCKWTAGRLEVLLALCYSKHVRCYR